jgi:AcrR family transcriptional regulator
VQGGGPYGRAVIRSEEMRDRILDVALRLLTDGGRDAVTTRAVTSALHIQAPTLYRIFGDKQGLLDATALHGFTTHLATWTGWQPGADPLDTIRAGWDMHVEWGLANPNLYSVAYGDARPGTASPASTAIDAILTTLLDQTAAAGLLRLPVQQGVAMLRAAGTGVVFTLLAQPAGTRDPELSTRCREAALAALLVESTPAVPSGSGAAMQLRAELPRATALTDNERALLGDWLDRIAAAS